VRILHIDTGREMRGGQWQVWYLLDGLRRAGVDSVLLCPPDSPLRQRAASIGIPVHAASPGQAWKLSAQFDLVHAHSGRGHTLGCLARSRPLVVARRVAFPVRRGVLSRWKYSLADRYIAVSAFVKKSLLEADVEAENVSVVYDGVPLIEQAPGGDSVVALESSDPLKGTALVKLAAEAAGVDLKLVTDPREGLTHAGLFVYLTESEGLGSGALLAMSAGVPVIASRVGGLTEVVVDGETGMLVENNVESVRGAILAMVGDPKRCRRMGEAGKARASELFSLDRMVEATMKVYEEVCG
jgi:glycosyltransferase involved in cell wall biosynthesis